MVARAAAVAPGLALDIEFADGHITAEAAEARDSTKTAGRPKAAKKAPKDDPQGSLL